MKVSEGFDKTEKAYRKLISEHVGHMSSSEMELVDIVEAFRLYAILSMRECEKKEEIT